MQFLECISNRKNAIKVTNLREELLDFIKNGQH